MVQGSSLMALRIDPLGSLVIHLLSMHLACTFPQRNAHTANVCYCPTRKIPFLVCTKTTSQWMQPQTRADSTFVCLGWALFVECLICCAQEFIPSNNEDPAPVSGNNGMMKAVF